MNRAYARSLATECFTNLYRRDQTTVGQYLAYCKGIRDRTVSDPEFEAQHLAHLELYERAEQLDFDEWTTDLLKTHRLVRYAVREGRCDIIEKYASRAPTTRAWNTFTSSQYQPCLYAVLHLVMPLPASMYDALEYVRRGLHLEVATHGLLYWPTHNTSKGSALRLVHELCACSHLPKPRGHRARP